MRLADARVAWLGLGRMGSVMAARLLAQGVDLSVWNRTGARCDPLVEKGAARLEGLADAASCDVVFSMVLDDAALERLHDPDTGIFSGDADTHRISVWVDGSTVSEQAAARAAAAAGAAGVAYVSAPISGNPNVVLAGNAIFAISGDDAGLDVAEEIGLVIGRGVHRVGDRAQANVVKLCTNALLAVTMQTIAEVAVLADKAGVSRRDLMGFVNDSAIGSPFSGYKTANVVTLDFTPTFTAEGQRKDLRLVIDLARELECPLPVVATAEVAYSRLVSGGLAEGRDFSALVLAAAQDAGHTLAPEELS